MPRTSSANSPRVAPARGSTVYIGAMRFLSAALATGSSRWIFVTAIVIVSAGASVLGAPVALVGLAVTGVVAVSALWRDVQLLLHLMVLSVFVESLGLGPARVGRVLAVAAVVVVFGRIAFTSWRPRALSSTAALIPVVAFLSWAWASALWAEDTRAWLFAMGQLGLAGAYFLGFVLLVEDRAQVRSLLRTYVAGALFASVIAFIQAAGGDHRAVGLQGDPNIFSLYQVVALPAAAMLAATAPRGRRWFGYVMLPVLLASVFVTQSRGGLVIAAVVVYVLLLRGDLGPWLARRRRSAGVVGLVTFAAAATLVLTLDQRFSLTRIATDRASGRLDIWYVAFHEWQQHTLLGIGGGNFVSKSVELLTTVPGVELVRSHLLLTSGIEVHNIYLEQLVEYGLVGFVLFLVVLVMTGRNLRVAGRLTGDPALRSLPMMLVAFLGASFFLSVVNNKLLWMLIALGVLAYGGRFSDEPEPRQPILRPVLGAWPLTNTYRPAAAFVALVASASAVLAGFTSTVAPPQYSSTVEFVVGTSATPPVRAIQIATLVELATGPIVAQDLRDRAAPGLTAAQVQSRLAVTRPDGALTFSVAVDDRDETRSRRLASAFPEVFLARVRALPGPVATGELAPITPGLAVREWGDYVSTERQAQPLWTAAAIGLIAGAVLSGLVVAAPRRRRGSGLSHPYRRSADERLAGV